MLSIYDVTDCTDKLQLGSSLDETKSYIKSCIKKRKLWGHCLLTFEEKHFTNYLATYREDTAGLRTAAVCSAVLRFLPHVLQTVLRVS